MLKFAVKRKPVELFHEAVHKKDLLRATFLLEQNESQFHIDDIDEDGITALQRTCFTGTLGLVQLLVTNGADINIQDNEGWSVLHAATVARNHSIMRYLIAVGAPLGLQNDQGELAIDLARDLQSIVILVDGMRRAGLTKEVEDYLRDRPKVRGILEEKLLHSDMVTQEQGRQRAASEIFLQICQQNMRAGNKGAVFLRITHNR
ncbi:PREDICTED: protein phosphatase 1 regulatory inhibitor subunit 16B-like [Acropora digitifera]|uniref:protein phosphatase 1 regulatory inhibitor subunit 16B-like n=1 Tax=Acropora digitifera TaxID=70779 RepID=UPI00077AE214|nr:PREDICTED: protein phosphatase 1 regulatory inhibitor subunit 16B-like [Acropora digitifera]